MRIDEVSNYIQHPAGMNRSILIGIEGYGGSGKTTLANKLAGALENAHVINIDAFIIKEKVTEPSWDNGAFDRNRLEQQVLLPASQGQKVSYEALLWESNSLSTPKVVPDVDYLIVEGISCYHPDIAHYYDYKIWVATPIEISKERGRARDRGNENAQYWDIWAENDVAYQQKYHPERVADFTVDNAVSSS
jgi:uridine kinase